MKIGIPNRSSFLHLGAVAQCVSAGILPWSEYHPAKLFYQLPDGELWLCRCDELCKHLASGHLDVVFTGDDYAGEHLRDLEYSSKAYAFIAVHFALLCVDPKQSHFDHVLAKYPITAKEDLNKWKVSYSDVVEVSGSSECFACSVSSSAAHDVMCTGATQRENKLYALHRGSALGCSWYFRNGKFPESLARVAADGDMFARLRDHYQTVLLSRDTVAKNTVGTLLNITNQVNQ